MVKTCILSLFFLFPSITVKAYTMCRSTGGIPNLGMTNNFDQSVPPSASSSRIRSPSIRRSTKLPRKQSQVSELSAEDFLTGYEYEKRTSPDSSRSFDAPSPGLTSRDDASFSPRSSSPTSWSRQSSSSLTSPSSRGSSGTFSSYDASSRNGKKVYRNRNHHEDINDDDIEDDDDDDMLPPQPFSAGDKIKIRIMRFGRIGASVVQVQETEERARRRPAAGMILNQELEYWIASSKRNPEVEDVLDGYVQFVRPDGKLDISLRPTGFDRLVEARNRLMSLLERAPEGHLPDLGDKASPEQIWLRLPGMSRGTFKLAVGALLREGAIELATDSMTLIPLEDRTPAEAAPYDGRSPRGFKPLPGATLFLGNLPFRFPPISLARAIEAAVGLGKLAKLKVAQADDDEGYTGATTESASTRCLGYAYASFFTPESASLALPALIDLEFNGRKMTAELSSKSVHSLSSTYKDTTASAVASVGRSATISSGTRINGGSSPSSEYSVFVGGLASGVTEKNLEYLIETTLGTTGSSSGGRRGAVVGVRIVRHQDSQRSRGFGFIDFASVDIAAKAVAEMNGMSIMGQAIRMDMDGPKKRPQSGEDREDRGSGDRRDKGGGDRERGSSSISREERGDSRRGVYSVGGVGRGIEQSRLAEGTPRWASSSPSRPPPAFAPSASRPASSRPLFESTAGSGIGDLRRARIRATGDSTDTERMRASSSFRERSSSGVRDRTMDTAPADRDSLRERRELRDDSRSRGNDGY